MIPMPTPPRYYPHQFPPAVTHASTNYLSRLMILDENDDILSPHHTIPAQPPILIDFDEIPALPVDDALGLEATSNLFQVDHIGIRSPVSRWVDQFTLPDRESPKAPVSRIRSPPVPLYDISPTPKIMCISNRYE